MSTAGPVSPRADATARRPLGMRARLLLSTVFIVLVAVAGMGYYVYARSQETNTFLTSQLERNVHQSAEATLLEESEEEAARLEEFFGDVSEEIRKFGAGVSTVLSNEAELGAGAYWNAPDSLVQLPSGAWDNPNDEPAAVFLPAGTTLTDALVLQLNAGKHSEFSAPPILDAKPDVIAIYFGGLDGETIYFPNIDLANIVPPDFDVTSRPWFQGALPANNPDGGVFWTEPYLDAALHGIVVTASVPVLDELGQLRGVAAMDVQLTRLADLVAGIRVGTSGYAFVIDSQGRLIAMPEAGYRNLGVTPEALPLGSMLDASTAPALQGGFFELIAKMSAGEHGMLSLPLMGADSFVAYAAIPEVGYSLAVVAPSADLLAPASAVRGQIDMASTTTLRVSLLLVGTILLIAVLGTWLIANRLSAPLLDLRRTAERIVGGDLQARASGRGFAEVGVLARSLNAMTAGLAEMIQNLEERVRSRTAQIERRAVRLQGAAEVGRVITSLQNLDDVVNQTAGLLSRQFEYYHVGVFLIDERGEYVVLRATNSPGGQRMLARGHRLLVGKEGLVGLVAAARRARVATDVERDREFRENPDLPGTRSEMALPLVVGDEVLGVLDIQSQEPNAFAAEDIAVLQLLADQLAVAIKNARLFEENVAALEATRRLSREQTGTAWQQFFTEEGRLGVVARDDGTVTMEAGEAGAGEMRTGHASAGGESNPSDLVLPVLVRGETLGTIALTKPGGDSWTADEQALAADMTHELGSALESARLYQASQRRAAREALIADITARIGAESQVEGVLRRTVEELGAAMRDASVSFQLVSPEVQARFSAGSNGGGDGKDHGPGGLTE